MSPKIRTRRRSAAASCNRIDFIPSSRAAFAWLAWLVAAGLLAAHNSLPWVLRLSIIGLVLSGAGHTLWSYVLLRGRRSVRALEWAPGEVVAFHVCIGQAGRRLSAVPEGCHRYGGLWLLRFRTCEGVYQLLVEAGRQDPRALRRLGRHLFGGPDVRTAARSSRSRAAS
jgi:hypothetical protein